MRENVALQVPRGKADEGVARVIEIFPTLRTRLKEKAGNLSGGQQQMLALSRAYTRNPRMVLIDEASLGLAPIIVDEIFAFLALLAQNGTALVVVEQFISRALASRTTCTCSDHGAVVLDSVASEIDEGALTERYFKRV